MAVGTIRVHREGNTVVLTGTPPKGPVNVQRFAYENDIYAQCALEHLRAINIDDLMNSTGATSVKLTTSYERETVAD